MGRAASTFNKNASGTPVSLTDTAIPYFYDCSYDSQGNLFVAGNANKNVSGFQLGELRDGQTALDNISLNRVLFWPAGVVWDGKYVVVGDGDTGGTHRTAIYQVAVKGTHGTIASTTDLAKAGEIVHFGIQGSTLIAPDYDKPYKQNSFLFYSYPKGRQPTAAIKGTFGNPDGAVVSLAR